ncbi:hypothetical protein SAMN06269250_5422 [Spirosoma fluviale]|uniref:Uncharacterized protein n=1 Tax=Spirosoma fluviale TaxID=1597977 RepID=A0A286GM82_9BACT|nr:hypothetical protein SAMN06269250_5422 [Spirosoma fluviale]
MLTKEASYKYPTEDASFVSMTKNAIENTLLFT